MPDETKPNPLSVSTDPGAAENNAIVAAKLASQDAAGQSTVAEPKDLQDASDALDALAKQAEEAAQKKADEVDVQPAPPAAGETEEQKAAREKANADAEKAKAEKEELNKKADEFFKDTPGLAPNAAPKSHEAFTAIKVKATQEITALSGKLEAATKEIEELKKNTGKVTPEIEAQLKETQTLKEKLAKFDVQLDPKFKQFDQQANDAAEFIYSQLRQSPAISEETINSIKKIGLDKVDMDLLFKSINDPTMRRLVDAKLATLADANYSKQQAIKKTQENISEYLKEKETESAKGFEEKVKSVATEVDTMLGGLDWFVDKDLSKGTDIEKAAAKQHNDELSSLRHDIVAAIKDDSPKMKAALLVGVAQLVNVKKILATTKAEKDSAVKELTELKAKHERVLKAGRSRLQESQAPQGGIPAPKKDSDIFTTKAADALDAIALKVGEERQAKLGR